MKKLMKWLSMAVLTVVTCFALFACAPADAAKAKEKMEKAGYSVTVVEGEDASDMVDGLVAYVRATKLDISLGSGLDADGEMVSAYLFDSASSAKKFWDEEMKDEELPEGWEAKQSGKWVIGGTQEAVKEFLK